MGCSGSKPAEQEEFDDLARSKNKKGKKGGKKKGAKKKGAAPVASPATGEVVAPTKSPTTPTNPLLPHSEQQVSVKNPKLVDRKNSQPGSKEANSRKQSVEPRKWSKTSSQKKPTEPTPQPAAAEAENDDEEDEEEEEKPEVENEDDLSSITSEEDVSNKPQGNASSSKSQGAVEEKVEPRMLSRNVKPVTAALDDKEISTDSEQTSPTGNPRTVLTEAVLGQVPKAANAGKKGVVEWLRNLEFSKETLHFVKMELSGSVNSNSDRQRSSGTITGSSIVGGPTKDAFGSDVTDNIDTKISTNGQQQQQQSDANKSKRLENLVALEGEDEESDVDTHIDEVPQANDLHQQPQSSGSNNHQQQHGLVEGGGEKPNLCDISGSRSEQSFQSSKDSEWMYNLEELEAEHQQREHKKKHHHHHKKKKQ